MTPTTLAIRVLIFTALVLVSVGTGPPARAWGNAGHETVCGVAYKLLSTTLQSKVKDLVRAFRDPDGGTVRYFTNGCTFADKARNKAKNHEPGWDRYATFSQWHYLNLPRSATAVGQEHCASNCVLEGIQFHSTRLANSSLSNKDRAEALLFLGHWVGDVHQPLHVSYSDDLGGNKINRLCGILFGSKNLHQVWDSGILFASMGDTSPWKLAGQLKEQIELSEMEGWRADPPLKWADESYQITTRPSLGYCEWEDGECAPRGTKRGLGVAYQTLFHPVVETRIQQAGTRLARLIEDSLN